MIIKEKKITAVVCDFDGTLIRSGMREPSERFFELLKKLLEQGVEFIAASGRQYPNLRRSMREYANQIGYIAENGTLVSWKGTVLYKSVIEEQLAAAILGEASELSKAELLVSGQNTGYVSTRNQDFLDMMVKQNGYLVTQVPKLSRITEEKLKIAAYFPDGIPHRTEQYFHEKYDGKIQVVESGDQWLDFIPKGSGKGSCLKLLAQREGLDLAQTAAFGDSENDISMLREAEVGYAMQTAKEMVRAAAAGVCECVEDILDAGMA